MTAENPVLRNMTAKEASEKAGCSPRTIQRIVAEPRDAFLKRSRDRGEQALALKEAGLKYREIGEHLGCSARAAESLVHRARMRRGSEQNKNNQQVA